MTVQTPPTNLPGLRPLSAKEQAQRAAAYGCQADNKQPSCQQTLWVGLFFDGTNNNKKRDQEKVSDPNKRSHSNVVVLHDAYKNDPKNGYFAYYIPGVGTEFEKIGEMTESSDGKSMAKGGEARLHWAMIQLYNAVNFSVNKRDLVSDKEALSTINNPDLLKNGWTLFSGKRRAYFQRLESRLKQSLGKDPKPKPVLINVSIFGFSRGAAEARAYCNWILECCRKQDGGYTFCGIPIRFQFLGLFDTVASVGLADSSPVGGDGLMDWADGTMEIPEAVERCVHYVAAHEIRKSFPVSTARNGKTYPANCLEVVYPGSHSDVGGGYGPGAQGKAVGSRTLLASQVPLVNMYLEAKKSGVPLLDPRILEDAGKRDTSKDLELAPELSIRFRDYAIWSKASAAAVETLLHKHMRLYWRWRLKVASTFKELGSYRKADAQDKEDLYASERDFQKDMARAVKRQRWLDGLPADDRRSRSQMPYNMPTELDRAVLEEARLADQVPQSVHLFFDEHIHDSHASFYLAGPVTDYDKAEKVQQAKEKQRRGKKLNPFEERILREDAQRPGNFPVMCDGDVEDLLDMEGAATGGVVKIMTSTRRESDGHVRRRVVFDKS